MTNKGRQSLQSISFGIMIVTLVSKTLGFFREIIFSFYYGTSNIADAYIFSLTVSTVLFGFIGFGVATSFIPVYTTAKELDGENRAISFTSNLITMYMLICILILSFVFPNTNLLVKVLAGGFDTETARIASILCKFSVFTIIATGIVKIYSGLLQINNKYLIVASTGLPLNIILITSIVVSNGNYLILGVGNLAAVFSGLLVIIPGIWAIGFKYIPIIDFKDEYIKKIIILVFPILISVSVNQINVLIDRSLASGIIGGISTLNYAHTIINIVNDVITVPLITAIYPKISHAFVKKNYGAVKDIVSETIVLLMYILLPATVILITNSYEITGFLFGRGAFDSTSIFICSEVLKYYAIGVPFVGFRQLLIRFFYANKDTKTPLVNASIAVIINIVLNFPLKEAFGLSGLALATSISAIVADVLLWRSMKKNVKLSIGVQEKRDLIKTIIISIVLMIMLLIIAPILNINLYIKVIVIVLIAFITYVAFSIVLKITPVIQYLRGRK